MLTLTSSCIRVIEWGRGLIFDVTSRRGWKKVIYVPRTRWVNVYVSRTRENHIHVYTHVYLSSSDRPGRFTVPGYGNRRQHSWQARYTPYDPRYKWEVPQVPL